MKHFTIKFLSLMVFTFVSFVSFGQYCTTGGPSSAADSNLGSFSMIGANCTDINYAGCSPAVTGVEDLTSTSNIDLIQGDTFPASVVWGTCGGNFGNAGSIWIDWNQNDTFDLTETVHTWSGTPTVAEAISIVIPSAATLGTTRMRVMQAENGTIPLDPCGSFTWGSVTDFQVTVVATGVLCLPSTNASISIADTFATVSFTAGTATTDIEYGLSGFTPGTGTMATGVTSPYVINGLTQNTSYDIYLIDSCAGSTCGFVFGPLSVTTACVVNAPYSYGFEGAFDACWVQDPNDDDDWVQNSGGTPSSQGPTGASEGSEYMYYEVSPTVNGDQAILVSPLVNVSALTSPAMRFDYNMFGSFMGTLEVQVDSALTGNWVTVWSQSGDQGTAWNIGAIPLANYGNLVKVRFVGTSLGCCSGDMAIDLVRFEEFCIAVEVAPFSESFEYGCYSQDTLDSYDWTISGNATPSGGTGANGPSDGGLYAFTESSTSAGVGAGDSAIMITQYVDISNLQYPELTFDYHMYDAGTDEMGELRAEMSNDMGMTWMPVWSKSGNQEEVWHQAAVNLQLAGAADTIGLRFISILGGDHDVATGTGNSWHSDISLDNIRIDNGLGFDLVLIDVLTDFSTCAGPGNSVVLEVENQGFNPVSDFDFAAFVNGVTLSQTYTDTIWAGQTAFLVLNNGVDLLAGLNGLGYGFDGAAFGDMDPSNDVVFDFYTAAPNEDGQNYMMGYEMGTAGWFGTGDFELGAPAGTVIASAGGGASSWVSNLGGNYSDNLESYIYSPCFDFSAYASDPTISFDVYWDIEDAWDGAWLETSTDGGFTWDKLGAMGEGTNWYSADVSANQPIGEVWNGTGANGSGGWVTASHDADGTAGEGSVQFRFVMWSDGNTNNEGLGVDNFNVSVICPTDLGLTVTEFDATDTIADAGAFVSASAGTGPYTYMWSDGQTTPLASGLDANVMYTVVVTDANGCTDSTSVTPYIISNDFISSMNELNIFPNPTQNTANVAVGFEQAVNVEVELVNVVGQILISERKEGVTNHSFTFDVSNYPAGVYMVRINANNERLTRRLVITK